MRIRDTRGDTAHTTASLVRELHALDAAEVKKGLTPAQQQRRQQVIALLTRRGALQRVRTQS